MADACRQVSSCPPNRGTVEDQQDEVNKEQPESRAARYAYMRSDGTLDIVVGSLIAGLGGYAYQFLAGRSLGTEGFAPIGILLTAHFLSFVIVLMPIEQFVIRRLTLGARGWVVPARAVALAASAAAAAGIVVAVSGDDYFVAFSSRRAFVLFVLATVVVHFFFAVGRGYLAGQRQFRSYGHVSAGASAFRLVIAITIAVVAPSVTGFALRPALSTSPKSIFTMIGYIMKKRHTAIGIETTGASLTVMAMPSRARANPGAILPSAMPAPIHKSTHTVR